jgi:Tol biopolymer transport system component
MSDPVWSPDWERIAFVGSSPPADDTGIFLVNADGSGLSRITDAAWYIDPSWSPQGDQMAFARLYPESAQGIYTMDADGTNIRRMTRGHLDRNPSWFPDGSRILFSRFGNRSPNGRLITLRVSDGILRELHVGGYAGRWSPDGKRIVIAGGGLDVIDADGTNARMLPPCASGSCMGAVGASWSPDGRSILTWDQGFGEEGGSDIWIMQSDGSSLRRLIGGPLHDCCASWRSLPGN